VRPDELYDFRSGAAVCRAEMADCYENGKGVPLDLGEALRWYESALALGLHAVHPAIQRVQKALRR
jgi:TPR repeat protein